MNPGDEDPIKIVRPQNEADIKVIIREYHSALKLAAIRRLMKAMPYRLAQDEAKDVLQEVFKDAWEKGIKGVEKTVFHYLLGMVRYKVIDRLRKRRLSVELDETQEAGRVDVEKDLENKERVQRARSRMSAEEQELFERKAEGQSRRQIADDLGTTPSAVGSKLSRARTKLKKLEEE